MYHKFARRMRQRRSEREFYRAVQAASPTLRNELLAARAWQHAQIR